MLGLAIRHVRDAKNPTSLKSTSCLNEYGQFAIYSVVMG